MLENEACNKISQRTHPYSAAGRRLITFARYPNFMNACLCSFIGQLRTLRTLLFSTEEIQFFIFQ